MRWQVWKAGRIIGYFRYRTSAERYAEKHDGQLRKCDS